MALVPKQVIQQRLLVPLEFEDDVVTLAAVDPFNVSAFEEIQRYLRGMRMRPVAVSKGDFDRFTDRIGLAVDKTPRVSRPIENAIQFISESEEGDRSAAMSGKEVMNLVNQIIATGIESGASDIHVEPTRDGLNVRYRINGTLETRHKPIKVEARKSLIARFKVLARLDITEARKPQEGRISLELGGRTVDLRLSLIPTKLGQNLVIRILDSSTALASLDKIVLVEQTRQMVRKMVYAPHGVVLVTGPTGSGKTTTMYSSLHERRSPEINIVTVEDPVEFHIDGLTQVEIGLTPGIDFASVLRSFLRQDPDIILVGETRDAETAKLALQAGLTGRLVFTSFHTNDCGSAIVRLLEMGMEPFALANALVGVIHQRLIRRLCPHCKMQFEYFPQVIENLRASGVIGASVPTLYKTKGCDHCQNQGFLGRVAAMEVLLISDSVRIAISNQASPSEILAAASKSSFIPLPWYLGALLQGGVTVPGEALSVLPRTDL